MSNDKEKLKRAKMYIDYLSNGVDPTDNMDIDENTFHNEEIIKCFKYISEVLERNISLYEPDEKRGRKAVFITDEQKSLLQTVKNRKVSEIAKEINRVISDNNTSNFQASWITDWLELNGYLCKSSIGDRVASEKGVDIGIVSEEVKANKFNDNIDYNINYYNSDAQNFIFRHLDEILSLKYGGNPVIDVNFKNINFPNQVSVNDFINEYSDKCFIICTGRFEVYSICGSYKAVLLYKKNIKIFENRNVSASSANRCILYGIKEAASAIKKPTDIVILSSTPLGFGSPKRKNYDLCREIIKMLDEKKCKISIAVCGGKGDQLQAFVNSQRENYPQHK